VGLNASLLSQQRTFEMYLANVNKTNDSAVQYEFALFMISAARDVQATRDPDEALRPTSSSKLNKSKASTPGADATPLDNPASLIAEARDILSRLSERSYPFAQYYLADGYSSGLFTRKQTADHDRAFPLFVAASKHGHAEAGYRAGLSYEFGWGTRRDGLKAGQFYRASATRSHPGALARLSRACILGDLGMPQVAKDGIRWLKRAVESADAQYNAAPYELGLLHEHGWEAGDVFRDPGYAAQLFTRAAELGNPEAGFKMGEAYELGRLGCRRIRA